MYDVVLLLVPLVLALTEYGKRLWKLEGWKAQVLSWGIGMLGGLLLERSLEGALLGLLAALVANGVFSLEMVKTLLDYLARTQVKLPVLLLLALLGTSQAQRFSLETGYQVQPVSGPYFLLRYNYPLAQVNLGSGTYLWLLPELGVLPHSAYLRTQVLLETSAWTLGTDLRWGSERVWRIFLRTEF